LPAKISADMLKDVLIDQFNFIEKYYPQKKLVIILDSIDQLNTADYSLNWLIDSFPTNVKMIYSVLPTHGGILENLKEKLKKLEILLNVVETRDNFIEIKKLDINLSVLIIQDWLQKVNRKLSFQQWELVKNLFNTSILYPLYIRLIYDIVLKWPSFHEPDSRFFKCKDIDSTIQYLFIALEKEHGKLLFSRAITYMSSFRNGISESEIEDILSLDDDVLYDIFEFHSPPIRRLPSALWTRVKHDLSCYMVEKEVDDTRVIYWYHRRFIEVASSFYISKMNSQEREVVFANVVDFFNVNTYRIIITIAKILKKDLLF